MTTLDPLPQRIVAPRPPDVPAPSRIPVMATLAPVVASIALWAITRSPFALAFAALGPVVAVASVADARVQRRRTRRREAARFARECESTRTAIAQAHEVERAALERRTPPAAEITDRQRPNPRRWRGALGAELLVRIGTGPVASAVSYPDGTDAVFGSNTSETIVRSIGDLRASARVIRRAPLVVDAGQGVGIVGAEPLVLAAARAIALQLAVALSPADVVVSVEAQHPDWAWLDQLPHVRLTNPTPTRTRTPTLASSIVFAAATAGAPSVSGSPQGEGVLLAIASTIAELPPGIGTVVEIVSDATATATDPVAGRSVATAPEFVSLEHAVEAAMLLREWATADGLDTRADLLPDLVALEPLLVDEGSDEPGVLGVLGARLACPIGRTSSSTVTADLVVDGPHAIVGGTTGSGKSELLLSWVLSMAQRASPADVTFLFVDFKGGASFDSLSSLPHSVGVITDLDPQLAHRALLSLRAELRFRERALADAGLRSLDDCAGSGPFPRLVVLVDEYAALVESSAELHSVFLDIAARGRSLGVHLILCTQRPSGVVREGILANSGLRISLRVTSAGDSTAVIGTADAASLPGRPRGRALMSVAGGPTVAFQVARSVNADVQRVIKRWASFGAPTRVPWCPPLPPVLALDGLPRQGVAPDVPFAMIDLPELQRQELGRFDPLMHGCLAILGASGSGKSSVLLALAEAPSQLRRELIPPTLPAVWDALGAALARLDSTSSARDEPSRLLLLDDIDAIVAASGDDYGAALIDRLARLLREGPSRGVVVAFTAQRASGALHSALALCGSRVLLRMPDRQEHLVAGGEPGEFNPTLPPGGGHWRGHRIQVLWQPREPVSHDDAGGGVRIDPADGSALSVVSTRPAVIAERIRARAPGRTVVLLEAGTGGAPSSATGHADDRIVVADPETWQASWGSSALLRHRTLVFDRCSVAEYRAITRTRELPPPCSPGSGTYWVVLPDGSASRATLEF